MAQGYWRPGVTWPLSNATSSARLGSNDKNTLAELINRRYDSSMYSRFVEEYYEGSGFHNYGYWTSETVNQRQASEKLVDVLVGFFPSGNGTVLDVACGQGASTRRLLRNYSPSQVTGINISDKQLATARRRAPGCRFLNMSATELRFPNDTFDDILCVEAAFHFDTREKFFKEAYRVLKPGGCLALSDILARSRQIASLIKRVPIANFVPDVATYRANLECEGFEKVRVIEARTECWEGFRDHSLAFVRRKVLAGEGPPIALRMAAMGLARNDWAFSNYLLVSACKPHGVPPDGGRR